ncbi:hypothetical protein V8C43DRAFT_292959 [Trichoderma afarasin]
MCTAQPEVCARTCRLRSHPQAAIACRRRNTRTWTASSTAQHRSIRVRFLHS